MPIKSLSLACAVAMLYTSIAGAQMDLGSLLNSIGYGNDDPPSVENLPSPADESAAAGTASPEFAADEFTDEPLLTPPSFEAPGPQGFSPSQELQSPSGDGVSTGQPPLPRMSPTPLEDNSLDDLRMIPPAQNPQLAPQPLNDFSAAAPAPAEQGSPAPVVQPIDQIDLDSLTGPLSSGPQVNRHASQHGCGGGCDGGCDGMPSGCGRCGGKAVKIARCLEAPNLPPPASSETYFKSSKCFNDLWGTYAADKACECRLMHKHIHGTCDCAEKTARGKAWKAGLCIPGRATSGVSLPH